MTTLTKLQYERRKEFRCVMSLNSSSTFTTSHLNRVCSRLNGRQSRTYKMLIALDEMENFRKIVIAEKTDGIWRSGGWRKNNSYYRK